MSALTYTSLVSMICSYQERTDDAFVAMIPTFINLAENRIATDMKQQGFQSYVTATLPTNGVMQKPSFWRETISIRYTDATGAKVPLFLRNLEYCTNYWPDATKTDAPKYYADYNATHFLIVPTPPSAYSMELAYYARLQPLSTDNQTNWLTLNAPQALLYACMVEVCTWAKKGDDAMVWEGKYKDSKSSIQGENMERTADRATVVTRP